MVTRKTTTNSSFALTKDAHVEKLDASRALDQYMSAYSAAVIAARALPQIDGLKPVQRRLLYTMWKQKLVDGKTTKLNNVGGYTMLLHPHGDASQFVYTLAAPWTNNAPFARIIGNGGTIESGTDGAANPRYTSTTLTDTAKHILSGLNRDAVKMIPSYDGERTEPVLLPVEYPNAFMNDIQGIAIGMRTQILPHNPQEIMDAILYFIDHPKATPARLSQIIKGPDFPTGGLLVDSETANLNELTYGHNVAKHSCKYVVRGEAKLHETKSGSSIEFVSIPYGVLLGTVISDLIKFAQDHQDYGIKEVLDSSSDYDQIKIMVNFKKGTSKAKMEQVLALIYKKTSMQNTVTPDNVMIADGKPQVMNIINYFKAWCKFRGKTARCEFRYELKAAKDRQEIVEGLLRLVDISDKVVADARESRNKADFKKILHQKYVFTERQSEAIASMALYRLGKQDVKKLNHENKDLAAKINKLDKFLTDSHAFKNEIKRQLREIKRTVFKDATRRTKLVHETKVDKIEINTAKLVKKQDVVVVVKRNGSVQRMSQQVYDNNIDEYDDKDNVVATLKANTQQGGLFFTKDGLAYFRFVNELENLNIKKDSESVQRVIPSYKSNDETIGGLTFDMPLKDQYVLSVSKLGRVKLTDLSKVIPSTSTKRYIKNTSKYFGLRDADDEVIFARGLSKEELNGLTLTVHRSMGRTKEKQIDVSKMNAQAGSGAGTRIWKLKDGDAICDVKLAQEQNDNDAVEQQDE